MSRKGKLFFTLDMLLRVIVEEFCSLCDILTGSELFAREEEIGRTRHELNKETIQNIDKSLLPALLSTLGNMEIFPRIKLICLINNIKDKERLRKLLYMLIFEKANPKELKLILKANKLETLIEVFDRLEPVPYNRLALLGPEYSSALGSPQPSSFLIGVRAQGNEKQRTSRGVVPPKSRIPVHTKDNFKPHGNSSKTSTNLGRRYINPNKIKPFLVR